MMISVVFTMMAVGLLLGFVGAGGSGFIIAILTVVFGFPIHMALGTALSAMVFSSLSGAISHYREGNAVLRTGLIVGGAGVIGAWFGSRFSVILPEDQLKYMTSGMLMLSGLALWLRMYLVSRRRTVDGAAQLSSGTRFWLLSCCVGIVTGLLSGMFGIGSTPFIQIGLMMLLGMSVRLAAGTTMLVIIPIALGGGVGYFSLGNLNIELTVQVTAGVMLGAYIGAKFTKRAPTLFLKTAMVLVPIAGGMVLLL
ncbi:MAG: hypothetical protein K0R67_1649 [Paenibacillus sp.]|nr:hypothetical protein [Paenibacillus sp.]